MEKEGYRRDVAAAVVAGAAIKGPIGPISIMFILSPSSSGSGPGSVSIQELMLSGVFAEALLFVFQALTVYVGCGALGWSSAGASPGSARSRAAACPPCRCWRCRW